ncbi:MAG: hypothetical protein ACR2LV_10245 [Solirubrobacteraceae bacterium]
MGERDPVIGGLQRAHPGQRPVLFHSPYEAAAWSIVSARRGASQAARVRAALSERLGATFELAGQTRHAFPQPERLLELADDTPGLNLKKVARLRATAQAALAGALDLDRLRDLGPEAAQVEVQRLRGIGPFYAGLIVLRATGFADAMPARSPASAGSIEACRRARRPASVRQRVATCLSRLRTGHERSPAPHGRGFPPEWS